MQRYLLAICIAFCCLFVRAEDTRGWTHVEAAWINDWSAIRFPESVESLLKTEISQYDDSGHDSSIGYRSADIGAVLTAYVYPQHSDNLAEGFKTEVGTVLQYHKQSRVIVSGPVSGIECSFKDQGSKVYAAVMQLEHEGKPMDSVLVLTQFDGRYLKLRISLPQIEKGPDFALILAKRFLAQLVRQQAS